MIGIIPASMLSGTTRRMFGCVGAVDVADAVSALVREGARFSDDTRRQTYAGSAHPDSETIYLRMPKIPSFDSSRSFEAMFNSLDVEDCDAARVQEFSNLLQEVESVICKLQPGKRLARAMLVKLRAGGKIHPHIDQGVYAGVTERYHLPITTNDGAWLKCGGEKYHLPAGQVRYFNKHVMHEGANDGSTDRVHLVVDFFI